MEDNSEKKSLENMVRLAVFSSGNLEDNAIYLTHS